MLAPLKYFGLERLSQFVRRAIAAEVVGEPEDVVWNADPATWSGDPATWILVGQAVWNGDQATWDGDDVSWS